MFSTPVIWMSSVLKVTTKILRLWHNHYQHRWKETINTSYTQNTSERLGKKWLCVWNTTFYHFCRQFCCSCCYFSSTLTSCSYFNSEECR